MPEETVLEFVEYPPPCPEFHYGGSLKCLICEADIPTISDCVVDWPECPFKILLRAEKES